MFFKITEFWHCHKTIVRIGLLITIVFLFCLSIANAQIYKCIDANGNTVYLDTPTSDQCISSEKIPEANLPPLIETKPLSIPDKSDTNLNKEKKGVNDYESVTITTPNKDESLRSNEGQVLISYASSPPLRSRNSHRYVVLLGSIEVYRGTNTSVALENLDRGTHTLVVEIVAANGRKLASSEPVTFTLQRYSRLHNRSRTIKPTPLPN